ncbi:MAG: hypothetical protein KOO62_09030 [candidate division Zixibacteria bacterium]|nr:hypothetical protein [candidate division Zixibacteria bacterium]
MAFRLSHIGRFYQRKPDSIRLLHGALAIVLLSSLVSCGTAHHFLPAQPLERGRWQISVSWHLNLNGLSSRASAAIPDVFGYYGLSDEVVIGTGGTFIFVPTFLNVAHYNESSPREYWLAWGHAKLFSPHDSPCLEAGGGYSKTKRGISNVILIGAEMGFGPGLFAQPKFAFSDPSWSFKYGLMGRDVGVSLAHHHGRTGPRLMGTFPTWPPTTDTIWTFLTGQVVDIVALENNHVGADQWGVILRSHDTLFWTGPEYCVDCFFERAVALDSWIGDSLRFVRMGSEWAIVDFEELKTAIRDGRPVTILRAPQSFVDRVIGRTLWIDDSSIGWAAFGWPD